MALGKQAKTLTKAQIDTLLLHVGSGRNRSRNRVVALLSVRAGLRAKEIAHLTWSMVLNSDGTLSDEIALQDCAAKGSSGRTVPVAKDLKAAMAAWRTECGPVDHNARIITTERAAATSAQAVVNMFADWYRRSASVAARHIVDGAPSSPMRHGRFQRSAALCVMFRRWQGIPR